MPTLVEILDKTTEIIALVKQFGFVDIHIQKAESDRLSLIVFEDIECACRDNFSTLKNKLTALLNCPIELWKTRSTVEMLESQSLENCVPLIDRAKIVQLFGEDLDKIVFIPPVPMCAVLEKKEIILKCADEFGFKNIRIHNQDDGNGNFNLLISMDENNPNADYDSDALFAFELTKLLGCQVTVAIDKCLDKMYRCSFEEHSADLNDEQNICKLFGNDLSKVFFNSPINIGVQLRERCEELIPWEKGEIAKGKDPQLRKEYQEALLLAKLRFQTNLGGTQSAKTKQHREEDALENISKKPRIL